MGTDRWAHYAPRRTTFATIAATVALTSAALTTLPVAAHARIGAAVTLDGTTERISVAVGGGDADGASGSPSISSDGRYVAYVSSATNLVTNDTNGFADVFVRDRAAHTTTLVSIGRHGKPADAATYDAQISGPSAPTRSTAEAGSTSARPTRATRR